ncbi:MAG: S-layer homology domain-containing protein [Clostridia bacterium]|nr:S-layer homology domain-containing protein [Clostridia bacterium]
MKRILSLLLALLMLMPLCAAVSAADANTYIYLRPENFKDSLGTWRIFENENGAVEGINLKGRENHDSKTAIPASAQIEIPKDGTYYVWTRSMDHETVPGTRHFKVALGEKVMPKKLATHGISGYYWELAGKTDLTAGKQFVKVIDTSGYYARCDAIVITDDPNYVPPNLADDVLKEVKKYQADPKTTSVADTTIPTAEAETAEPPKDYKDPSVTVPKDMSGVSEDGKTLIVTTDSAGFFGEGGWGGLTRGQRQGLWSNNTQAKGIWHPNITEPVKVKLSFFAVLDYSAKNQDDTALTFEVYYGDGNMEQFSFDLSKMEKEGFVEIGTFDFTGTGKEFVRFIKVTSGEDNCSRISDMKFEAVSGTIKVGDTAPSQPEVPNVRREKAPVVYVYDKEYTEAGPWSKSEKTNADGKDASVAAAQNAVCAFVPNLAESKTLKVEVYNDPTPVFGMTPDTKAEYTVFHNGKTNTVSFDMTQKAGWYALGEFDFAGTPDEYVLLKKANSDTNTFVRATAVRFSGADLVLRSLEDPQKPAAANFIAAPANVTITDIDTEMPHKKTSAFFIPSEAKIVSHGDAEYKENGTWLGSGLAGYYDAVMGKNTSSRYSFDPKASASWGTGGIKGTAEVSIYKLLHANSDNQVHVTVTHSGQTDEFYLDFTTGSPGWVSLGVFEFAGTPDEGVTLDNFKSANTCRANAVRYEQCAIPVTVENGIATAKVDGANFDALPKTATKQGLNYETVAELLLNFDYAEKGLKAEFAGDKVNLAKKDFKDGYLGIQTPFGKLSLPLSEITVADDEALVIGLEKVDGKTVKASFEILSGGQIKPVNFAFTKQAQLVVNSDLRENKNLAFRQLDGAGSYIPAYIDRYGAFGERAEAYIGKTFQDRLNEQNNEIFAMAEIAESGTYGLVQGNVTMPDMEGHWAKDNVNEMASKGLVSGKGNGYDPEADVTRAEFATMLLRAVAAPQSLVSTGFTDVPESEWFAPYVNGANQAGLFEGIPFGDTFEPNKPITREEMSAMIVNGVKVAGRFKNTLIEADYYLQNFADKASISPWATEFVARATELGIIMGIERDGVMTFQPAEKATRAQAAVMLKRFLDVDAYVGPLGNGKWVLTFHDEFDGDDLNDAVWDSVNGPHSHINSSRYRENVEVHDGKAFLITKDEDKGGKNWTSASIWTREFEQTYGYFEAKYKYPNSESMNYNIAFWLYKSMITVNDSKYYEIDINEGRCPGTVQTAEHWSGDNMQSRGNKYMYQWMPEDFREDYHIFAAEWTPEEIVFYVDGREIRRHKTTYSNHPMQVYLSTAIMNEATEEELLKDADGTAMEVEYVRVYQRAE